MLHEIFLSLLCPDSQFLKGRTESLELNLFLHPSEKYFLQCALKISKNVALIQKFSENVKEKVGEAASGEGFGMYMKAFIDGIENELVPYNADLIGMQEKTLLNPSMTMSELQCFVTKHYASLNSYCSLINQINNRHLKGGQLLQLIYENLACSDDLTKQGLSRILQRCHVVFFKQLSSWLFYGLLHDQYREFFIQPSVPKEAINTDKGSSEKKIEPSEPSVDAVAAFQFFVAFNPALEVKKHEVDISLVPSYISYSLAQKMVFLGETILMLSSKHASTLKMMDDGLLSLIYNGKEKEYMRNIIEFEEEIPLKPYHLEQIIDKMRSNVMEYLWKLAVTKSDLYGQLRLIKDFYLLSHGELFTEFLSKSDSIRHKPLADATVRMLNCAFQQAVRNIGTIKESSLYKFQFSVLDKNSLKEESNIFNCLKLMYKAEWPLQLFFTPEVLHNYNVMFLFLLRIKKIQMDLHGIWLKSVKQKTKKWNVAWQLRTGLMFLIDNLQYYLQVDVLETEFSALMKAAIEITDFEKLQQMHLVFLAKILTHSFVSYVQLPPQKPSLSSTSGLKNLPKIKPHPVNLSLMNIFAVCEKYVSLITSRESPSLDNDLQILLGHFNQHLSLLLISMSELTSRSTNYKHLNQFLLRLDFNNWFTNKFDLSKHV